MVKVYHARVGNLFDEDAFITPHKGTITWASRLGGMIIPDTAEEVAMCEVDAEGRLMSAASGLRHERAPPSA